MKIDAYVKSISEKARTASRALYGVSAKKRNGALCAAARIIRSEEKYILSANNKDVSAAQKSLLSEAMIDRLTLSKARINSIASALEAVAKQKDPLGSIDFETERPNGMVLKKVRVPIGTILIIYESRPNVTIDSAGLCLKAGNSTILRGGKEAIHSNTALATLFKRALKLSGLPVDCVQLVESTDREIISSLVRETDNIDLVIPRGGEALIRSVTENSRIPVLKHYKGLCHVYVDKFADVTMAKSIVLNSKIQRPGVCNAIETLLIDTKFPRKHAISIINSLVENGIKIHGCPITKKLISGVLQAKEADYFTEYLSLELNVRFVDGVAEAASHINRFGSMHTDSIVTSNRKNATEFLNRVDSSSVMWNVSTRLADGGEYGLGAEIGISTDKLHSRGPMGAYDLTTYKWIVTGNGQLRK